jgi:hypothetical protein
MTFLLGMLWHVAKRSKGILSCTCGAAKGRYHSSDERSRRIWQSGQSSKYEHQNFSKKTSKDATREELKAFQLIEISNMDCPLDRKRSADPKLIPLLKEYSDVFRSELPDGWPPKRSVDHAMETEHGAKPSHRSLYQLSPAEMQEAKEYVVDLMKKGMIRPRNSPYGAPLLFVKDGGKPLRGVVDYRALNRMTKKYNAPLQRSDEMFDRLGEERVFSKLDLKTGFHQIRLRPEDIENVTGTKPSGATIYVL